MLKYDGKPLIPKKDYLIKRRTVGNPTCTSIKGEAYNVKQGISDIVNNIM